MLQKVLPLSEAVGENPGSPSSTHSDADSEVRPLPLCVQNPLKLLLKKSWFCIVFSMLASSTHMQHHGNVLSLIRMAPQLSIQTMHAGGHIP